MHAGAEKTVCTSQLRQRCASATASGEIEAEFDFGADVLQRDRRVGVRNLEARSSVIALS